MTSRLTALRLSIVDFLGVFLPGALWGVLILTTVRMLGWTMSGMTSVLLGSTPEDGGRVNVGGVFYVGFVILSLLMGYVVKSFSARPAERVAFSLRWLFSPELRKHCRDPKVKPEHFRFPYRALYQDKSYFPSIARIVQDRTGQPKWEDLPGYQPFEACKSFLKVYAPALWEEAQRREAQSRFIVSLSLAALYSTVLALIAVVTAWRAGRGTTYAGEWLLASTGVSCFLSYLLWKSRWGEVGDVYLFTLIADRLPGLGRIREKDDEEELLDD
jgi:hypothetical protein